MYTNLKQCQNERTPIFSLVWLLLDGVGNVKFSAQNILTLTFHNIEYFYGGVKSKYSAYRTMEIWLLLGIVLSIKHFQSLFT